MTSHIIRGGDGVRLSIEESGQPDSRPILFIHGFSQCGLSWRRQMTSDLARSFRLITMDLRGHGRSDKPADQYADGRLWAEDVHAVIQGRQLDRPVLVGWSYAGFVICDYLRYYGDQDIAAINFVCAATSIAPDSAPGILGSDFLELLPGFFSHDAVDSVATLQRFVHICGARDLDEAEFCLTLGYNTLVPPSVRQSLLSRTLENDDVLRNVGVPVLVSQGARDRIVQPHVAGQIAALLPGARLSSYPESGHAVFFDDPDRFNLELAEFARAAQPSNRNGLSV